MKYILFVIMFLSNIFCFSQDNRKCNVNSDTKYNRLQILDSINKRLNKLNEFYQIEMPRKFSVTKENFYNFFIYDLVDTSNKTPDKEGNCIEFTDDHIYHIAALRSTYKVSIILILSKGKFHFFEGLNCSKKINDIEEVLNFVKANTNITDKNILNRIANYQDYHLSHTVDPMGMTSRCINE
ncbi:hypothetical protein GCM10023210_22610 [Chryseobacterium ginsengisoli]|uniref:TPM domain-containing protein n=1 Tax=Chryseobacterium ginsengisoli TaxID=363853 RepID=A0ABP9MCL5_9FLAO